MSGDRIPWWAIVALAIGIVGAMGSVALVAAIIVQAVAP